MADFNVVAEFTHGNLKLCKNGVGIFYNAPITKYTKKEVRSLVGDQDQKKVIVVAGAGATETRTANEKAILYDLGFSEVFYLQPTVALASYLGYQFIENVPVLWVVIGDSATDIAIILDDKILYSGILDIGVNTCIEAISNYIQDKYQVEATYTMAKDIFWEVASLLPNDSRFVKFPDFIVKAEQVRLIIYPFFEKIIGAINHLMSEASADIIRQINNVGVIFGGVGANIRGLAEAVYAVIGLSVKIAVDPINAPILGAMALLETPQTLLNLIEHA